MPVRVLVPALALLIASVSAADESSQRWIDSEPPPGAREEPLRSAWQEAIALERAGELQEAARRYEALAAELPTASEPLWRRARCLWRYGERLPVTAKDERRASFSAADDAAREGLERDENCAECMLWRVASMGRLATTNGVVQSARQAPVMAEMIDRAIALAPKHRDSEINSTLGNLYYSGAVFYRMVPDWFWMEWVLGVRGDKERSVAFARQAVAESGKRIDYAVELGAALLCLGTDRDDEAIIEEGRQALRAAATLDRRLDTDSVDMGHAQTLFDEPDKACGFSRDGWIQLDEEAVAAGPPPD